MKDYIQISREVMLEFPFIIFTDGSEVKASASNEGDLGSIPGSGRSLEKEMAAHSNTLAWKNPTDGEAW